MNKNGAEIKLDGEGESMIYNSKKNSKKKVLMLILVLIILAVAGFIYFSVLNKDSGKLPSEENTEIMESKEVDKNLDSDQDRLPDYLEEIIGTDKNNFDTDGDGYSDFDEIKNGYNPLTVEKYSAEDWQGLKDKIKVADPSFFEKELRTPAVDNNLDTGLIKNTITAENVLFEIAEGNSLIKADPKFLSADLLNKPVEFYGRITDTSAINMFYVQSFDGVNAYSRRYYLENRVYINPHQSEWVKIIGKYSNIDAKNDAHKIDVISFEKVADIDEKIKDAKKYLSEWLDKNRKNFDLNEYKKTERFRSTFNDLQDTDLNNKKFESMRDLIFVDGNTMTAGIVSGKIILRENIQRGDYLYYLSIFDLDNMKLLRVIVKNDGYFAE